MKPYLLHQLLARSAERAPEGIALIDQARTLSYGALEKASNRLAHVLRRNGIEKGDRVGIHLDKSAEAVVAIFGVLKAGAAYVPIDPKTPVKRAAFIAENCQMRGLITTRERLAGVRPALGALPACTVLVDGEDWAAVASAPPDPPPDPGLIENDLAYILYTSGSTGEPKGVMISHRAALSFVNWAVDYFGLHAEDRLSNHAPLHFDLSVFDLFGAAASGASVALVPPAVSLFPRSLADWIEASRITLWYSVPSALVQLSLHGGLERHALAALRLLLFAGEVFPVRHLRRLMEQVPHPAYFNLYGPTETNVCTVHPVSAVPSPESGPLPIGRACANTEVFVVEGELYVRGPTLMLGYWGRPEQTRASLLPHPLFPERPERVYRTGDLVRLDESGDYYFLGRRDAQVKSRGYRIELGEIESVLYRHPQVAEAAVVALPDEEFGCTLHAAVAVRAGVTPSRAELAAFCSQLLPAYMVPSEFRLLASLPKTSTGKVDREALRSLV